MEELFGWRSEPPPSVPTTDVPYEISDARVVCPRSFLDSLYALDEALYSAVALAIAAGAVRVFSKRYSGWLAGLWAVPITWAFFRSYSKMMEWFSNYPDDSEHNEIVERVTTSYFVWMPVQLLFNAMLILIAPAGLAYLFTKLLMSVPPANPE